MAGKRIVIPNYMPALDLNGFPLPGAKITFYENETTTLASVYANEALTVPLANPVVSNLAGVFPSIFADEDLVFTVAITDADDNPIGGLRNKDEVRPSQIFGADSAAAENANAAAQDALSQINDIVANAADAPSVVGKVNTADLADDTGAELVGVIASGTGAVARTAQAKFREAVSVADYLNDDHDFAADDATYAFEAAMAALGDYGGDILVPKVGDYRVNFTINKSNVRLVGRGGVGELSGSQVGAGSRYPALRPFNTGAGTFTVRVADGITVARRVKLDRISICGDNGSGGQAEYALLLAGGTVNVQLNVDLSEGIKTLAIDPRATVIDPTPGLPVTGVEGYAHIRNDVLANSATRAYYVRKYSDALGYVTALNLQTKMNRPADAVGYAIELDGTGSTGLAVHLNGYLDSAPDWGILMHGFEVLVCDAFQFDPGAAGTVAIKRLDNFKDPSRFIQGFVEGWGGQKIEYLDNTQMTLPVEPGPMMYEPRIRRAFMGSETFWTPDDAVPYDTTVYTRFTGPGGYRLHGGIKEKWENETDVSGSDAANVMLGGLLVSKNIKTSGGSVTAGVTSYDSGRMDSAGNWRMVLGGAFLMDAAGGMQPGSANPNTTVGAAGAPFARSYTTQITVGSSATTSPSIFSGAATPEGSVTAPVGSVYLRTGGGAATSFYVKETGTGNTGWAAK